MNCKYVEQLLPLYIGRDLEEQSSVLVADHLQSCKRCADAADEYDQAKQLLQRFEAPSFSPAVYAGIRRQVLNEIERKSEAPGWSTAVSQFFGLLVSPRMRWITAALVLAISVTAFYFITRRSNQIPNEVNVADGGTSKSSDGVATAPAAVKDNKVVNAGPTRHRSRQREKTVVSVAHRGPSPSRTTNALSSPDNALVNPAAQPSSTHAPLRVEIQTSDRNIRIIWLSSQLPQTGARDTSKGI